MIRVVVADDHPAPRAGIVHAINRAPDIRVVGEAENGTQVWEFLAKGGFEVLLLDLNMPGFDPDTEVRVMRKQYPGVRILVVTADDTEESVSSLVEAKVAGYLLKDEDLDRYIEAIHDVAGGKVFFSKRILPVVVNGVTPTPILTRREMQVLQRVAEGDTSEQIAQELKIAKRTADYHVGNIMNKLNVESRAAAAVKAMALKLISASVNR